MGGGRVKAVVPEGSYLASTYRDSRRDFETRRVYYEDGRVEAFDGQEWWTVCHFSQDQINQTKEAIRQSGLLSASDLGAEGIHDTASLTYAWRLDKAEGQVTNWAYPARSHPNIKALETTLDDLENQASQKN